MWKSAVSICLVAVCVGVYFTSFSPNSSIRKSILIFGDSYYAQISTWVNQKTISVIKFQGSQNSSPVFTKKQLASMLETQPEKLYLAVLGNNRNSNPNDPRLCVVHRFSVVFF